MYLQVKPFTEGLRLNPEADAEALAHSGVLILRAPEALVKAEHTSDLDAILNPDASAEPSSNGAAALAAAPQAAVHAVTNSTAGNSFIASATIAKQYGDNNSDGPTQGNAITNRGLQSGPAAEDGFSLSSIAEQASVSRQDLPVEDTKRRPNTDMALAGCSESKRHAEESMLGTTTRMDDGPTDHSRAAKRHKSVVPDPGAADIRSSTSPTPNATAPATASADDMSADDMNRSRAAREPALRKSQSPRLTTKDGSPSSAAPVRSVATPSRVKVPKQQSTISLT